MTSVNFCGASGKAYNFSQQDWGYNLAQGRDAYVHFRSGIALLATDTSFGWRVIQLTHIDQNMSPAEISAIYQSAWNFGARAVFFHEEANIDFCMRALEDLLAGFNPICDHSQIQLAA